MDKEFRRKIKENRPVVAICYDFDKTLSPDDMQAQGFIQKVKYDVEEFWTESNKLAKENGMDQNLAWMYMMIQKAAGKTLMTKESLRKYGAEVELFNGVKEWFERIRKFGEEKGVIVEHYIISSGLKEMIEGTSVADEFECIYASSFYFDSDGVAKWPAQVINYTGKTQFLFRIEKGVLDVNDQGVNDNFPPDKIRVPFRNMIYIGDSDTDIPCMKLVNSYGGHSIGVYDARKCDKTKVYKMMRENRIRYFAQADYTEDSDLDGLVKDIIIRTVSNEKLEERHIKDLSEQFSSDLQDNNHIHELEKLNGIVALEGSESFANTHTVISTLKKINDWTQDEIEELFEVARSNGQINYIITDSDVKDFYKKLLKNENCNSSTENAIFVKEEIK